MGGLVWGGFLLVKKLMSEQSRESWLKIVALIIIGGAFVHGKNVDLPIGTELYIQTKADEQLFGVQTTLSEQ